MDYLPELLESLFVSAEEARSQVEDSRGSPGQ